MSTSQLQAPDDNVSDQVKDIMELQSLGINVSDLQKLKDLARIKGCELLTTEKDYLRIKKNFRKNIRL